MDDTVIVDLYLSRDETAIRHTTEKFGPRLRSLAYAIVQDCQTAEECENDTYWEAWKAIPPHEPRRYLYNFLACITRHLSLDVCRRRDRLKRKAFVCELSAEMEECIPAPDDVECRLDEKTLARLLNEFLAALPPEKRNIFVRRYWYLDPVADIAKRYSLSQSKVKTTLFRCRNQLRDRLKKEGFAL